MGSYASYAVVEEVYAADAARMLEEMRAEETRANPDGKIVGHQNRVALLARGIAIASGFAREDVEAITLAARFHDIGKLDVDRAVLDKPGRFTPEERAHVDRHSDFGAIRLERIPGISPVMVDAARYHHERYDGGGTFGLEGEDIPVVARILTIADVYDALVTPRVYKAGVPAETTLLMMTAPSGTPGIGQDMFDPGFLRTFVSLRLDDPDLDASPEGLSALRAFADSPVPEASAARPLR